MLVALAPLIMTIMGGVTPAAALAGLGLAGWAPIVDAVLTGLPEEIEMLSKLHPIFAKVTAAVEEGSTAQKVTAMAHNMAQENYEASLHLQPGMGSGVVQGDY